VRIYYSREKPIYLPYYVPDRIISIEVKRQYRFWVHLFYEKRKRQCIPLPWKIGEILLRSISKIDEFEIQFDPNYIFINQMTFFRFNISLINTF